MFACDRAQNCVWMNNRYASGIVVPKCGCIRFTENGRSVLCDKDHPVYLPKGATYKNECLEDADSCLFNFEAESVYDRITVLPKADIHLADIVCRKLIGLYGRASQGSEYAVLEQHNRLLDGMFSFHAEGDPPLRLERQAADYISEHFGNCELNCRTAASFLGVSEVYLRKLFLKYEGIPIGKYITRVRMEAARALLLEKCPVGRAAELCGYADIYVFSRAYKNYFGSAPSETSGKKDIQSSQ